MIETKSTCYQRLNSNILRLESEMNVQKIKTTTVKPTIKCEKRKYNGMIAITYSKCLCICIMCMCVCDYNMLFSFLALIFL